MQGTLGNFGFTWARFGVALGHFGVIVLSLLVYFGVMWVGFGHMEVPLGHLGPLWDYFGFTLGAPAACGGDFGGTLGSGLGQFGVSLGICG